MGWGRLEGVDELLGEERVMERRDETGRVWVMFGVRAEA